MEIICCISIEVLDPEGPHEYARITKCKMNLTPGRMFVVD